MANDEQATKDEARRRGGDGEFREASFGSVLHRQFRRDGKWVTYQTVDRTARTITTLTGWSTTTATNLPSPQ